MSRPERTAVFSFTALLLLWAVGLFGRGYWTPDEPREAALAASVAARPAALPSLAGSRFAEKPPLSYWLAGASMRVFGNRPAAARLPQLLYALLGFFAVLALARTLLADADGRRAAAGAGAPLRAAAPQFAAALLFATAMLVQQVQIWLDTDALLLAGVALALAGMYRALQLAADDARSRRARLRACLVMHLGLTLAFFAKNFAAWLVPVLAFLCFIAWERRWRELARRELWLAALLPLGCIALWVGAVAAMPDGTHSLRVLFWNNLAGRAFALGSEPQYAYASGHPNWPGRYFVELPMYLLPWTVLAAYALGAAWRGARAAGPRRAAWRFALCAALPGLLLLSFAATARSIYAAPCMIGFALLVALWVAEQPDTAGAGRAWVGSALVLALIALLVLASTIALQFTVLRSGPALFLLSLLSAAAVSSWSLRQCGVPARAAFAARAPAGLLRLATAWCALFSLGVLSLYGAINRTQDLQALAARVARQAGAAPLLLWQADETTLAWAQLYLPAGRWSALDGADADSRAALAAQLRAAPATVVVSMAPGRWSGRQWLDYLRSGDSVPAASAAAPGAAARDGDAALAAAGLRLYAQAARPGGRGYLLWRAGGS